MPVRHEDLSPQSIQEGLATRLLGRRVLVLDTTPSTMDVARQEAERGAPEGLLVLAEEQTAGRGRFGRRWVSPRGVNLYLSLLLRPPPSVLRHIPLAGGVAVVRAVRRTTGLSPVLKWPNDVLLGGRKVSGLLAESHPLGPEAWVCILGVGINVNWDPSGEPEVASLATSLRKEAGHPVSRLAVLRAFLEEMEALYLHLREGGSVLAEWRALLTTLGQRVRVAWGERQEEGMAEDVDAEGNLLLRRADGSLLPVPAGDVTLVKES